MTGETELRTNPRPHLPWVVALGSTGVALALRMLLDPHLGSQLPFVTFFLAVTFTAYFANLGATVFAIVLGYFSASWFFVEPRYSVALPSHFSLLRGLIYFAVTGCVAAMSLLMARSRARVFESAVELARRQQHLELEIAERERAQDALVVQSRLANELLDATDRASVTASIAKHIYAVADGALVTVSEFDPADNSLTICRVECSALERERLHAMLGREPCGMRLYLPPETRSNWSVGHLALLSGGIHELVFGQLPADMCDAISRDLGLVSIYAMACSYQEDILGTVALLSHTSLSTTKRQLIEALVVQSGLALRRVRSELALRHAEERLRVAHELSLDAFTILDAVRDEQGKIIDFRWSYVNPIAGRILLHPPSALVGKQLLQLLPGNKEQSDLFDRYVRVVETGEPHDCEIPYQAEGIAGWFRNMAVRNGDGVAVCFSDITERKRAEAATVVANERLLDADRRKDDFIAVLSHELRNPLAAISSSLQVLERSEPKSGRALGAQAVMGRQVRQLSRLVDDLLDVTRISRNKVQLHRERVELNELVRRSLDDHRPEFEKAGVLLCFEPAQNPVWVDGDTVRLAQIMGNLLLNSAKFSGAGERTIVSVLAPSEAPTAIIRVADTGAGVDPRFLARLFEPFIQADTSLHRSHGGLGLGLALVKGLVELHGGSVTAASAGIGCGAEFEIRLPRLQHAAAPNDTSTSSDSLMKRKRILVVDDNIDAADSLRELLTIEEHEVAVAYSGPGAIEKARQFCPELLLCDIGMPGMDGYEVARAFRADEHLRSIVLVALSGYTLPDDLRRAKAAGFSEHIAKPPSIEQLQQLLTSLGARPGTTAADA